MQRRVAASVLVVLITVACSGAVGTSARTSGQGPPSGEYHSSTTPHGPNVHPRRPLPKGTARSVVALPNSLSALGATKEAVFGLSASKGQEATPIRLDPPASVTTGASFSVAGHRPTMLTIAADTPWVATHAGGVARIDPSSLTASLTRQITPPIIDIAGTSDDLWVAAASSIYRLDPGDGAIQTTFSMPAPVMRFAVAPGGDTLYVALTHPVHKDAHLVEELDASTGSVVARTFSGLAELNGPSQLLPTAAGVWIPTPTGNMGAAIFYRASDLHPRPRSEGDLAIFGTNSIHLWATGGVLWEEMGDGSIACIDPVTGRSSGLVYVKNDTLGIGGVVAIGHQVWTGAYRALDVLRPPRTCQSI